MASLTTWIRIAASNPYNTKTGYLRHVGVVHKFFKEHFEEAVRRHNDETKLTTRPSVGAKRNLSVVKIQSFLFLGPLPKLQLTVGDAELHHSDTGHGSAWW